MRPSAPRDAGDEPALYNLPCFNRLAEFSFLLGGKDGFESNFEGPAPVEPEIFAGQGLGNAVRAQPVSETEG